MRSQYFSAPRDEEWFFETIAISLADRLASLQISREEYAGIAQLLYAIQSFPRVRTDLSIYISWQTGYEDWGDDNGCPPAESNLEIEYSDTGLYFIKDNVRLEYRRESNKLLARGQRLTGEARQAFLNVWIEEFAGLADPDVAITINNSFEGAEDASPPLSEFWNDNVRVTENPFE